MDLWDENVDFVINSCNRRNKVVELCDNLINNFKCMPLSKLNIMFYLSHYKICLILAKKNVQDEKPGLDISSMQHNTSLVTLQPDDL